MHRSVYNNNTACTIFLRKYDTFDEILPNENDEFDLYPGISSTFKFKQTMSSITKLTIAKQPLAVQNSTWARDLLHHLTNLKHVSLFQNLTTLCLYDLNIHEQDVQALLHFIKFKANNNNDDSINNKDKKLQNKIVKQVMNFFNKKQTSNKEILDNGTQDNYFKNSDNDKNDKDKHHLPTMSWIPTINITNCTITTEAFYSLIAVDNNNLDENIPCFHCLEFISCEILRDDSIAARDWSFCQAARKFTWTNNVLKEIHNENNTIMNDLNLLKTLANDFDLSAAPWFHLQALTLTQSGASDLGFERFFQTITKASPSTLQALVLSSLNPLDDNDSNPSLTPPGLKHMAVALPQLTMLTYLDLSFNIWIGDEGVKCISSSLNHIVTLKMDRTNITNLGLECLITKMKTTNNNNDNNNNQREATTTNNNTISYTSKLETLCVCYNYGITKDGLMNVFQLVENTNMVLKNFRLSISSSDNTMKEWMKKVQFYLDLNAWGKRHELIDPNLSPKLFPFVLNSKCNDASFIYWVLQTCPHIITYNELKNNSSTSRNSYCENKQAREVNETNFVLDLCDGRANKKAKHSRQPEDCCWFC